MPDLTPNLHLKKPLGNENVTRSAYNENLDIIDQNAAKSSALAEHMADTTNPHGVTAAQAGAETPAGSQAKIKSALHNLTIKKLMGVT